MITRENYEEQFLLYVDNELTAEQKAAVDAFVLLHPDLKEELDLLCGTQLQHDTILFINKEELLAGHMKVAAVDESLLLYIDDELPAWEKEAVERQLVQDETFALQYQILLKTKLEPVGSLLYPDKKELYRHTERRLVPYLMRMAAAVLIVAGSAVVWTTTDVSKETDSAVAVSTPKQPIQKSIPITKQVDAPGEIKVPQTVVVSEKKGAAKKEPLLATVKPKASKRLIKTTTQETFSKPHITNSSVAQSIIPVRERATADNLETLAKTDVPGINKPVVTSDAVASYVAIDAAANTTVPVHAVATTNEKSGGMKVFLRKATRFIERRTGIKTVNDNDELLVGAVALKL